MVNQSAPQETLQDITEIERFISIHYIHSYIYIYIYIDRSVSIPDSLAFYHYKAMVSGSILCTRHFALVMTSWNMLV